MLDVLTPHFAEETGYDLTPIAVGSGAPKMVGGNVRGETRVLTTATVLEVSRGNFAVAVALSLVLLLLAYAVNLALTLIQQRRRAA